MSGNDASSIVRACLGLAPYPATASCSRSQGGPFPFVYGKCDVGGPFAAGVCSGTDASLVKRAVLGLSPGLDSTCNAATGLSDSDGDGVRDEDDSCPYAPNPEQVDGDSVGVGDVCDNCPSWPNPDQADDGGVASAKDPGGFVPDGIGNVCQCGDVTDDGRVGGADVTAIDRACTNQPPHQDSDFCTQDGTAFVHGKCDVEGVVGGPGHCSLADADAIQRGEVQQVCPRATGG